MLGLRIGAGLGLWLNMKFGLGIEFALSINCQGMSNIALGLDYGMIGPHWRQLCTAVMEPISPSIQKLLFMKMLMIWISVRTMEELKRRD